MSTSQEETLEQGGEMSHLVPFPFDLFLGSNDAFLVNISGGSNSSVRGVNAMKRTMTVLSAAAACATCSTAYALYTVRDFGAWPKSWPAELEPFRKLARTLEGPVVLNLHFAIPFTNRAAFESAWPHILKVKGKEAQLVLVRGPNFFLGDNRKAGVVVHCPPAGEGEAGSRGMAYSIELIVDGKTVDLNRISLPADTPIVDNRFSEAPQR
jgi:hypothetical protein